MERTIDGALLPENISEVSDDILQSIILCETTKRPFRIVKQELAFYRKHNIPLPRKHPDQRHTERIQLRNPRKLWDRNCDNCGTTIQTSYAPERKEKVYCEDCFQKEVYG
jgi:CxxC-x17-CxxC domain-containing protein